MYEDAHGLLKLNSQEKSTASNVNRTCVTRARRKECRRTPSQACEVGGTSVERSTTTTTTTSVKYCVSQSCRWHRLHVV